MEIIVFFAVILAAGWVISSGMMAWHSETKNDFQRIERDRNTAIPLLLLVLAGSAFLLAVGFGGAAGL